MGKKYTTHTISIGDHNLDAPVMVQINALIAGGLHSEAGYLTEESGTTRLTDAEIAAMGYIKTYTDTDTNTQLSDAQIAEMGYIKTYTDTNTNTQLTSAQIAAMGYLSTATGLEVFRSEKNIDDQGTYMFAQDDGGWTGGARLAGAHNGYGVISMHLHTGGYYGQIHLSSLTGDMGIRFQENSNTWGSIYTVHTSKHFSTTDVANGVTAHGWGNHADAGYLTSYTDTDTNTQLSQAQVGAYAVDEGFIKEYTDTNTQLTSAQIAAMGYVSTSQVDTVSGEFPFMSKKLSGTGIGSSYDQRVVLIVPRVTTNTSSHNKCVGKITASKTGGNVFDTLDISVNSVWNNTEANFLQMGQRSGHKWVTCLYGGVEWIAIKFQLTHNPYTQLYFHGQHKANSLDVNNDSLKVISYLDTISGVLNAEINNSITDWTSSSNSLTFNGNNIHHAGNLTNVSQLANDSGYITSYTDTDTNTQLTDAEIAEMGYIKTYTDTNTNTQLTTAQIAAMGYIKENEDRRHKVLRFTGEGSNSNNSVINYGIYQEGGAWTHPYPDLVIGMHTGIKIGGAQGYNGTRFYSDAPGRTGAVELMSVGNGDGDVRVTNVAHAGNSFRAPYFYSPGDTTYFLDPASSSVLFSVSAQHFYGNLTGNASTATKATNLYGLGYIQSTSSGTSYQNNYQVRENNGAGSNTAIAGAPTLSFHWSGVVASSIMMQASGRIGIYNNPGTGYEDFIASTITASSSHRAPIFYDSNNTAYYIHADNHSYLHTLALGGNSLGFINKDRDAEIKVSDDNFNGTGAEFVFWGDLVAGNAQLTAEVGNFTSQVRTPVLYDSNNTAYVVNPASTSTFANINAANFFGTLTGTASNANLLDNIDSTQFMRSDITDTFFSGQTSALAVENQGTFTRLAFNELRFYEWDSGGDNLILNNGHVSSDSSFRAPIFYDSNDTNYYLDPNSASYLNNVYGNRFSVPISNLITIGDNAATYTYKDTSTRSIFYASSAYPALVLNSTASTNSNHGPTIQFSHNGYDSNRHWVIGSSGTGQQLDFGTAQASNYNPHVGIGSYQGITCMRMTVAGNVGIGGTWGFQGSIANPSYDLHVQGNAVATTSSRAPLFYDSNNTGYYTNPAGTSIMQRVTHINTSTPILIKVNSGYKSWVHHVATSDEYIIAPSATDGGEDWDWTNQVGFSISGVVTANNFKLRSDERLKTNIKNLDGNTTNVNWKSFEMKGNEGEYRTGVIAQELEENHPEFVNTDEKGFKSVKYIDLLIAKIAELEARLEILEK